VFAVNVFGTFLMMQNVLPIMQTQRSGAILNFGSVSGLRGYPYEIAYGASKAAIIHMTKNAANENGGNGVRINAISPGWVDTSMMRDVIASYKDVGIENSSENVTLGPTGRAAKSEEVASVAVFMCSDEASYVNGANFLVDGGMTLG
jgi:NAD(P)-dependent dehydrogenase (short-subunit alcohol dehydrogenase family)